MSASPLGEITPIGIRIVGKVDPDVVYNLAGIGRFARRHPYIT